MDYDQIKTIKKGSIIIFVKAIEGSILLIKKERDIIKPNWFVNLLSKIFRFKIEQDVIDTNIYYMDDIDDKIHYDVGIADMLAHTLCENEMAGLKRDIHNNFYLGQLSLQDDRIGVTHDYSWHDMVRRAKEIDIEMLPRVGRILFFGSKWDHINTKEEVIKYAIALEKEHGPIHIRIENDNDMITYARNS